MSSVTARGAIRAATAAPDPPEEPPEVRVELIGLRQTPFAWLRVAALMANSGTLVFAITTAPAFFRASTSSESRRA